MGKKSVLVVEDHELWQKFLADHMREIDADMTLARDYGEGMQALSKGGHDLLVFDNTLLDIANASVDLIQAAHRFRSEAPIIVFSADLPSETQRVVEALGAVYANKTERHQVTFRESVQRLLGM